MDKDQTIQKYIDWLLQTPEFEEEFKRRCFEFFNYGNVLFDVKVDAKGFREDNRDPNRSLLLSE